MHIVVRAEIVFSLVAQILVYVLYLLDNIRFRLCRRYNCFHLRVKVSHRSFNFGFGRCGVVRVIIILSACTELRHVSVTVRAESKAHFMHVYIKQFGMIEVKRVARRPQCYGNGGRFIDNIVFKLSLSKHRRQIVFTGTFFKIFFFFYCYYLYIYTYNYTCTYTHIHICICICVCMYICVYVQIHVNTAG